ncbi:ABC transporter ATP-binding protein [Candidatus Obscuribacterales bacterium]|nr:ABC transporter ATP-binding protein [Candidatus Obscuribacterales bacterium]MBX3150796.1 ABC transporter ATP-binding protein [Candidatus Obscuribacterales bacterium]
MTGNVIEARGLSKDRVSSFLLRRSPILDGLSLSVKQGETYGLLGPNGAGKTTTVKILVGLMRPDRGEALVLGEKAGAQSALRKIGFLPENPYFYSHLTGLEFLEFIGQLFGLKKTELRDRVKQLLELVSMTVDADKPMRKYSKGMLQRLGIAQSLINDPEVVFWDEPMSGLDPIGRRDVRKILLDLKARGKTIFFNSHLLPDVSDVCDRVGVLAKGKLVAEDEIKNIVHSGGHKDLEEYFLEKVGG